MTHIIMISGIGFICLIIACVMFYKKRQNSGIVFFAFGVLMFFWAADIIHKYLPNGLPPELKTDGDYRVKIVSCWKEKGEDWLGILHLPNIEEPQKENDPPLYKKVLASRLEKKYIVYGIPTTIELRTLPSRQVILVKEDPVK